jgi:hypothetical protein
MLQQILVVILVLGAVAFAAWRLMPARRRLRALLALDRWAAGHPRLNGWRERSLIPRIARAGGTGCDGCAANDTRAPRFPR